MPNNDINKINESSIACDNADTAFALYRISADDNGIVNIDTNKYQINADNRGNVNIDTHIEVYNGEDADFFLYNHSAAQWDSADDVTIEIPYENNPITVLHKRITVDICRYSFEGIIKLKIIPRTVGNGSNTIAWITDGQYYLDSCDNYKLLHYFNNQIDGLVDDYKSGKIAYVVNTGDTIEHVNNKDEFDTARKIYDKLNSCVPNGIVSGNHDVGEYGNTCYDNWKKSFGESYYRDKPWYGGCLFDNTCHYDLITIAEHDFIFLYIGMGYEDSPEVVSWCNRVLSIYKHRTAVLCLHEYLTYDKKLNLNAHADTVWNDIIENNENVRMVLCGHDPGREMNVRTTKSGREVVEIMYCYQFHAKTCDKNDGGKGLFRYITFEDGYVKNKVFSATCPEIRSYYDEYDEENFNLEFKLSDNTRTGKRFFKIIFMNIF